MTDELSRVLDEPVVARLASELSYARGVVYLEQRRIGALRSSEGRVTAAVQGTDEYLVELTADGGWLRFGCSCPIGREGVFCKHCVAVALAWLRGHGPTLATLEDARRFLETLSTDQLVELLIDHAHEDEQLSRRLLLLTSRSAEPARADPGVLRALIDQAFSHRGFVSYREVWGWVRGIDETIDLVEQLLGDDRAAEVIELAEHALAAAERAMDHVDDSDGEMGGVIARLERLHLQACERATPDPVSLAERLFAWELNSQWDIFDRAPARYAGILGEAGVSCYRELAEAAWVRVPRLGPGDRSGAFDPSRFRITRIMETLAELSGDLAQQIAIRERDLSSGYRFVEIAELCREHGKDDAALEYAERGMVAFAEDPDPRLRAFARDQYRRRGRLAEAYEQSLAA